MAAIAVVCTGVVAIAPGAQAMEIAYDLHNVSATFNVAPGVGGFPQGFASVLTFSGSFVFDTGVNNITSVTNFDIFRDGDSLNASGFNTPGYGPNIANAFTANTWTVSTNALLVSWTFAADLALGATTMVTASSIYTGYDIPVTMVVTGSAETASVPEPLSIALFGAGIAGLSLVRRPSRRKIAG